nr:MAG TPA: hypothetical protein [Caudoviricetes sp.]
MFNPSIQMLRHRNVQKIKIRKLYITAILD